VRFVKRGLGAVSARAKRPWKSLARLGKAPARLWAIFGLKFLESFGYFSLSLVLTQFLTDEVGMDDTGAGLSYGLYGTLVTLLAIPSGLLCDGVGLRAAVGLGAAVSLAGRVAFALVQTEVAALLVLFLVLPVGTALGIPVLGQAVKQHTDPSNRAVAFAVFYAVMAAGQVAAGFVRDLCVLLVGPEPKGLSGYRVLLLVGAGTTLAYAVAAPVVIRDEDGRGLCRRARGRTPTPATALSFSGASPSSETPPTLSFSPPQTAPLVRPAPSTSLRRVARERDFWRLMLLLFASVFLKMIFRHMDATFPKYMARQFSDMTPTGTLYALNPLLVLLLVPLLTAWTSHLPGLWVIIVGGWISALSLFFLTFGNHIALVVLFVVTLTLGESLWSPRLYEYASVVAPRGQEGIYGALSGAPLFLAKLPTGALSGVLVAKFLPEDGTRKNGQALWAILGGISLIGPLLMTLFRWTIVKPGFEAYLDGSRALPGLGLPRAGGSPRLDRSSLPPADAGDETVTRKLAASFARAEAADRTSHRRTQSMVGFFDGGLVTGRRRWDVLRRTRSCPDLLSPSQVGHPREKSLPAEALEGEIMPTLARTVLLAEPVRHAGYGSYVYEVMDSAAQHSSVHLPADHTVVTLSAVASAVQQPMADPTWLARILSDLDRAETTGLLYSSEYR